MTRLDTTVLGLTEIRTLIRDAPIFEEIEAGFVAYSNGKTLIPPVGELLFPEFSGEAHIKYGAIRGEDYFVVKVATGFYDNPKIGLPSFGGCMLLFSQKNGQLVCVLLDEGELTNVRTAAAGAVAARHLAPSSIQRIGICGTGVQARLQAGYLRGITSCRELIVWGRSPERARLAAGDIAKLGFNVSVATDIREIGQTCNLIVTTTAAQQPYLLSANIRPGTHITAIGSDTAEKAELDPALIRRADVLVVDSLSQCRSRGEVFHVVSDDPKQFDRVVELGSIITHPQIGRCDDRQITIADLTGVAVQDLIVASCVYKKALLDPASASE